MYLPEAELTALHRQLAGAVRPGGTLLVVLHHPDSMHAGHSHSHQAGPDDPGSQPAAPGATDASGSGSGLASTPTGQALLAFAAEPTRLATALDPAAFEILVADVISRQMTDRDGQPATAVDTVLRAVRRS